jgi:hypothetical protein
MTGGDSTLEIRSFRSVFALERRIYRLDTLRLNPGGIPLRGIAYAAVLVLAALVAGALPPTAWLDPVVPWYVRDVGLPVASATIFTAVRVEGRPFHLAALAIGRLVLSSRRTGGLAALPRRHARWRPPVVLLLPDGSDSRFRALRFRGPGAVLVALPHVRREWRRGGRADLTLHPLSGPPGPPGRASVLELAAGAVLEIRRR